MVNNKRQHSFQMFSKNGNKISSTPVEWLLKNKQPVTEYMCPKMKPSRESVKREEKP